MNAYDQTIRNVASPELSDDAANKNYVDSEIAKTKDYVDSEISKFDQTLGNLASIIHEI